MKSEDSSQPQQSRVRQEMRLRRREMTGEIRAIATARIVDSFLQLPAFQTARIVAGFLAFDGEADPIALMTEASRLGKQVYVPVIVAKNHPLKFAPWHPQQTMRMVHPNSATGLKPRLAIAEPDVSQSMWITPNQLDFVIHPLVAFDVNCHRLGVGGGYYDRTFQFRNQDRLDATKAIDADQTRLSSLNEDQNFDQLVAPSKPILAGFAFEIQRLAKIQRQPWDVVLDWVITERQLYRRRPT